MSNGTVTQYQIGQTIGFTTPSGEYLRGKIVGRDWAFSTLLAYTVRTARGQNYHVNPNDFKSGHSF